MEVISMKFRLFDWTDVVDEAGEKWEKYAVVKEWNINRDTPAEEILGMVKLVKDTTVDFIPDYDRADMRAFDCYLADVYHFMSVLRENGWKFLDDPDYEWGNEEAIVFNSKFKAIANLDNFDTFIKEEMEKFKEMMRNWDYA